jgi:hypothetical protein
MAVDLCRAAAKVYLPEILILREGVGAPNIKGRCPQRRVETISILGVALLRSWTFVLRVIFE